MRINTDILEGFAKYWFEGTKFYPTDARFDEIIQEYLNQTKEDINPKEGE